MVITHMWQQWNNSNWTHTTNPSGKLEHFARLCEWSGDAKVKVHVRLTFRFDRIMYIGNTLCSTKFPLVYPLRVRPRDLRCFCFLMGFSR